MPLQTGAPSPHHKGLGAPPFLGRAPRPNGRGDLPQGERGTPPQGGEEPPEGGNSEEGGFVGTLSRLGGGG